MRLLVSVRSGTEARAALDGGAQVIDAKEPANGPLGPVDPAVLREIVAEAAEAVPVSVALGDVAGPEETALVFQRYEPLRVSYLKLGFAGVGRIEAVEACLKAAVAAARARPRPPRVVAVAYADWGDAGSVTPQALLAAASYVGANAVLLDTFLKNGRDLFASIGPADLADWIAQARRLGLESAVAGGLRAERLRDVIAAGPDLVGVRGAACVGGRDGVVVSDLVRRLRAAIGPAAGSPSGETPEFGPAGPDFERPKVLPDHV